MKSGRPMSKKAKAAERIRKQLYGRGIKVPEGLPKKFLTELAARHGIGVKPKKKAQQQKRRRGDGFYRTKEWKQVRYKALRMANGRCQCCGRGPAEGAVLNVDHIRPRSRYPDLALSLSNLQVLCGSCNAGKGGWDQTDWRPAGFPDLDAEFRAKVCDGMTGDDSL